MTNKKSTKRALLMSVLSLVLCVTMLMGTTFAWFTDSVTSASNVIMSGNLDVELEYWDGDSWEKVENSSKLFDEKALWEPGYTHVVYLKVSNLGSLALKYKLGVNIVSETTGKTKDGATIRLSDYIYMDAIEGVNGETSAYADRAAAMKVATEDTVISMGYTKSSTLLPLDSDPATVSEEYVALIVHMPETVGNEANHDGVNVPKIELGIKVQATQNTVEDDAFDADYDAGAPFSMWDGVVPTEMPESLVVDGATQTVHVKDAAAFAYLSTLSAKWADLYTDGNGREYTNYANGAGANYYYSGLWTVSLEADIDLGNYPIDPVVVVLGQATGASAFNGNYHTIRNINTTTGLFANDNRITYADLTLKNVKATNGALTGASRTSISNVTVKNATISGVDYVGGLVGYIYGDVIGCKVFDSSVNGTKEVGGLIGYIASSSGEGKVTANKVNNVSVYANNRAAGLVAQANTGVKVYNNIIDTVTVGAEDTTKYQSDAVVSNAIVPENVYSNTVKNANVISKVEIASDKTELKAALDNAQDGDVIVLGSDIEAEIDAAQKTDTRIVIDGGGNVFKGSITVDGKSAAINSAGIVIRNIVFDASATTYDACVRLGASGNNNTRYTNNVTVENCTFIGDGSDTKVAIKSYTGGDKNLTVKNCVATDMHSLLQIANAENLTVEGCTVTGKRGLSVGASSNVQIIDTVINAVTYGIRSEGRGNGGSLTVTDCDITASIPVVIRKVSNAYTVTFNGNNSMTETNGEGLWCVAATNEYGDVDKAGLTAVTADVTVNLNDASLDASGIFVKK